MEMLFKVYSKYVPNLTRRDGSAFEKFLGGKPTQGKLHLSFDEMMPDIDRVWMTLFDTLRERAEG